MYILIAYKPNSEDYRRNCLMASYSSDHEVHSDLDDEELIIRWADYLYKNLNLSYGERGYRFWLFKDGVKVIEESQFCYYYDGDGDEDEDDDKEEVCGIISELEEKANKLAKEKHQKILDDKRKVENERRLKQEQEDLLRRRAEYEKLKNEFEQENL